MTINVTDAVGANNTIVFDSNSKIPAFDGSQVTALSGSAFTTGTLAIARIDVGTGANQILQLDANAKLPALSATNLTNVPGPTVSTSDPAIDTNSTLGKKWVNKTSGEAYICTDATTDENVWTNVGAGTGSVSPWAFQGTQYGYRAGGYNLSTGTQDVIEKYSFTSDGNATNVGDTQNAKHYRCGGTGTTHGYSGGGASTGEIDKWSYSSDGDSTDVGDLALGQSHNVASSSDGSYVFWHDGQGAPAPNYGNTGITKNAFASDGNSVDTGGDLLDNIDSSGGHSSSTHGYNSGGTGLNQIQKFSFAISSGTASDVGNLTQTKDKHSCYSSTDYGYSAGTASSDVIDRFAYASDGDATDWGDLNYSPSRASGTSSTTHGYTHGGHIGVTYKNHISKISFASAGTSGDVGDLTLIMAYGGHTGSNY